MLIGGLQRFSLLDYPGHISAIVFTQGCNFRCHFCYNPMLVRPLSAVAKQSDTSPSQTNTDGEESQEGHLSLVSEDGLFSFLKDRRGKLDAVVITGGEPTLHDDLPEFMTRIRALGFKLKLDTNGSYPEKLGLIIDEGLVDYIAMDIKSAPAVYDKICGIQPDLASIQTSINLIRASGRPYEFRTTLVPGLHDKEDIEAMGDLISGADKWFLQNFHSDTDLLNTDLRGGRAFSDAEMEAFRALGSSYVRQCLTR